MGGGSVWGPPSSPVSGPVGAPEQPLLARIGRCSLAGVEVGQVPGGRGPRLGLLQESRLRFPLAGALDPEAPGLSLPGTHEAGRWPDWG